MEMLDRNLFVSINSGLAASWFDPVMAFVSSQVVSLILVALLISYPIYKKNWKLLGVYAIMAVTVILIDHICYNWLKPFFARLRPCHGEPEIVRFVYGCGGRFGFPSNHAANSFALATQMFYFRGRRWGMAFAAVSLIVGFSRVYLGVHYPFDVLTGFLVGGALPSACFT